MFDFSRITQKKGRDHLHARAVSIVLALGTTFPSAVYADALVTLCHTDDEPGAGMNLSNALAAQSVDQVNTIRFQCPVGSTIITSHLHEITKTTVIDGGNAVALDPVNFSDMFFGKDAAIGLYLNNLTIRRAGTAASNGSVVQGKLTLALNHTLLERSVSPIALSEGSVGVYDSQLIDNTGTAVIEGTLSSLKIERSDIQNPGAVVLHVGGKGASFSITDTRFSNNGPSVVDDCSSFDIRGSTFVGHKAKCPSEKKLNLMNHL